MGFMDKWPSRMQGQWFFFKSGGRMGNNFRSGPENLDFLVGQLPLPEPTSPIKVVGETSMSTSTSTILSVGPRKPS